MGSILKIIIIKIFKLIVFEIILRHSPIAAKRQPSSQSDPSGSADTTVVNKAPNGTKAKGRLDRKDTVDQVT